MNDDHKQLAATWGAAIREARLALGLTQEDVAEQVELSPEVYGRMERGAMLPSVPSARRICVALRLDPAVGLGLRGAPGTPLPPPVAPVRTESTAVRALVRRARRLPRHHVHLLSVLAQALEPTKE